MENYNKINSDFTELKSGKVNEVLMSLGMTKTEVAIYLDLFMRKASTPQEISRRSGIYRSNTYEALRRLKKRGFVGETENNGRRLFQAKDPGLIKEYLNQKAEEVDEVISLMKRMEKNPTKKEVVSVSHGINSVRSNLMKVLELKEPVYVYDVPIEIVENLGNIYLNKFHRKRAEKKILMKTIFVKKTDRVRDLNKLGYSQARYFLGKKESSTYTLICGNCVFIVIFGEPMSLIEINSKEVAESHRKKFEVLWKSARL
jgi:sugar-specific transcriptional regulator TrmB